MACMAAMAQIIGKNIEVLVSPDRDGWNYNVGETAVFNISVLRSGSLLKGAKISYKMGEEMYEDTHKSDVVLRDGTLTLKGTMRHPGFLRLTVNAEVDGRKYEGMATAAFSPERLQPVTSCPADFDAFWSKTLADARAAAPLQATRRLLPERCTEAVDVYEVSFQNIRWGSRTYGILCIPTKPGKYPVVYKVPGAGCRPYQGDPWWAAKGYIVLEIGIHGVPVTYGQSFYDDLANGPLNGYWNFNLDNRDASYYKRVVVGAVRGVDYIAQLPEWDGKNLGVMGSSQGGWLSIVTAALAPQVSCYAPVHPALCDHTASLKGVACGWPHYFYDYSNPSGSSDNARVANLSKEIEAVKYYDGVNFASRIKVPGWFSFGYNDDVVPPTTVWATYNTITAPKEIKPYPKTKHFWYQEQYDEWVEWLSNKLTTK